MKITVHLKGNKQFDKFIQLVQDFYKANNNTKFKGLDIIFKYNMRSQGEYDDTKTSTISINPTRCDKTGDFSLFLICCHELSHLLDKKFGMFKPFEKEFKDRLLLTTYAKGVKDHSEELAEIISLFLREPFLLKLISEKHYEFISKFFNTPTDQTKEYFISQYENYTSKYKEAIRKKHGIFIKGKEIYKNNLLLSY